MSGLLGYPPPNQRNSKYAFPACIRLGRSFRRRHRRPIITRFVPPQSPLHLVSRHIHCFIEFRCWISLRPQMCSISPRSPHQHPHITNTHPLPIPEPHLDSSVILFTFDRHSLCQRFHFLTAYRTVLLVNPLGSCAISHKYRQLQLSADPICVLTA